MTKARSGGNDSRQSCPPEMVVTDKRKHQNMRQRKPDRAQLFGTGRPRIHHPAGDVQMGFGVAVIERIAMRVDVASGSAGQHCKQHEKGYIENGFAPH